MLNSLSIDAIDSTEEPMVSVLVYENDDTSVYAQVPERYAEEYIERIQTDKSFAIEEANYVISATDKSVRALPEGNIIGQGIITKDGLRDAVDRIKGTGKFMDALLNYGASFALNFALKALSATNPIAMTVTLTHMGLHIFTEK